MGVSQKRKKGFPIWNFYPESLNPRASQQERETLKTARWSRVRRVVLPKKKNKRERKRPSRESKRREGKVTGSTGTARASSSAYFGVLHIKGSWKGPRPLGGALESPSPGGERELGLWPRAPQGPCSGVGGRPRHPTPPHKQPERPSTKDTA